MDIKNIRKQLSWCKDPNNIGRGLCHECCPLRENSCCEFDLNGTIRQLECRLAGIDTESVCKLTRYEYLEKLLDIYENKTTEGIKRRTAVYGGSFNPFHNGHMDIVKQAAALFDKIYVVVFINPEKMYAQTDLERNTSLMAQAIKEAGIENCEVLYSGDMLVDFCKEHEIKYNVRGLRNGIDFGYEENMAEANGLLYPDLETVYLRSKQAGISSTFIRQAVSFGKDVSEWVPPVIAKNIK